MKKTRINMTGAEDLVATADWTWKRREIKYFYIDNYVIGESSRDEKNLCLHGNVCETKRCCQNDQNVSNKSHSQKQTLANPSNRHSYRATFLHKSEWLKFLSPQHHEPAFHSFDQIIKRPYSPAVDSSSAGGKGTPSEEQEKVILLLPCLTKNSLRKIGFLAQLASDLSTSTFTSNQASSQALEEETAPSS